MPVQVVSTYNIWAESILCIWVRNQDSNGCEQCWDIYWWCPGALQENRIYIYKKKPWASPQEINEKLQL